jgi:hypothetical protein
MLHYESCYILVLVVLIGTCRGSEAAAVVFVPRPLAQIDRCMGMRSAMIGNIRGNMRGGAHTSVRALVYLKLSHFMTYPQVMAQQYCTVPMRLGAKFFPACFHDDVMMT